MRTALKNKAHRAEKQGHRAEKQGHRAEKQGHRAEKQGRRSFQKAAAAFLCSGLSKNYPPHVIARFAEQTAAIRISLRRFSLTLESVKKLEKLFIAQSVKQSKPLLRSLSDLIFKRIPARKPVQFVFLRPIGAFRSRGKQGSGGYEGISYIHRISV